MPLEMHPNFRDRPGERARRVRKDWRGWRIVVSVICLASSRWLTAQEPVPAPRQTASNILLIIADDVGIENLPCYGFGSDPAPTPHIDRLAREGVLFRNAWSNPVCSATRATIMTGRHAFRTGIGFLLTPRGKQCLRPEEVTFAQLLSQRGYNCGLVGKWHLGGEEGWGPMCPQAAGWSYSAVSVSHKFRCNESYYRWTKVENGVASKCCHYNTSETVDDALTWIGGQHQPWMCCVAFNAAHSPWHAPPSQLHGYDLCSLNPHRHPRPFFLAAVQAMDTEIGRLLDGLGSELADTTVIFVGDNGTSPTVVGPPYSPMQKTFNWFALREKIPRCAIKTATGKNRAKGTVYEAGVHVPLIVAGPIVSHCGREANALVHTVDLFATILELGGVDGCTKTGQHPTLDSKSLVPYLTDPDTAPIRDTVYTEVFIGSPDKHGAAAIRDARYKLVADFLIGRCEYELFDLLADPLECHNLLSNGPCTAEQRSKFQSLLTELGRLRTTR